MGIQSGRFAEKRKDERAIKLDGEMFEVGIARSERLPVAGRRSCIREREVAGAYRLAQNAEADALG